MAGTSKVEKIDIFTHILPPKYKEVLDKKAKQTFYQEMNRSVPALWDLDARFRIMDRYNDIKAVLSVASPPLEMVVDTTNAKELSIMANDEMAELVAKFPERFVSAVACLPLNDMDAALSETDRAINELGFKGIQLYTPADGKPLDSPKFIPLYEKMLSYDLPIWIHPVRDRSVADYMDEDHSKHALFMSIGWPFETSKAMCRLVLSGILEKYSGIKFIVHHCGAMIPFFGHRIGMHPRKWLNRLPIDYLRMFYGDTALHGNKPALMCGYEFFGVDHIVFATDTPYVSIEVMDQIIGAIESMNIPGPDKQKIFSGNAKRLLRMT